MLVVVAVAVPAAYCTLVMIPVHGILDEEHERMDVPLCWACVGELLSVNHSDEVGCL